ncbi:hypothetical protein SDC9_93055 [bioreactor metagenome]|uniref:DUF2785 domain-containing protein n=1 Tax=bioreactor metagenome TaxID=1076179 RepID=A0A645A0A8_9ZZZZ|nr:DUF2785 domain-containing protein [Lutispora sp.]MEA4960853.1 DUF2785 domain-containing protein [Lutispora sp.]
MEQREQLLIDLQRIKKNQYKLNKGEKATDYVSSMLNNIGDPDPELRDFLIYRTFYQWIRVIDYFNEEELRSILSVVLDQNHLYYNLGSEGDDSVFKRSFSVLVVALILEYHRNKSFLCNEELLSLKNHLIKYYREEKDLRSYVNVKGWADAVSHGADALDELIACKECNEQICYEVLEEIKRKLLNGRYSFHQEEDERLTCVIIRIIKSQSLSNESINKWIDDLVSERESMNNRITRINIKNFIRSLYFRLMHLEANSNLIDKVFHGETKLNTFL